MLTSLTSDYLAPTQVSSMITRFDHERQEQDVSSCSSRTVQDRFKCSLTRKIMKDPVTSTYGDNFERKNIMKWIKQRGCETCPLSGRPLKVSDLTPNCMLQWEIMFWQRKHEDAVDVSRRTASTRLHDPLRKVDAPPSIVTRSPDVTSMKRRFSDTPPSVPRRKYSDIELPSLCDMMINKSEPSHRNIAISPSAMANVTMAPKLDFAPSSPLKGQEIIFILNEVDRSLIFDDDFS